MITENEKSVHFVFTQRKREILFVKIVSNNKRLKHFNLQILAKKNNIESERTYKEYICKKDMGLI